jgi:Tol biopolymer transport system component
MVAACLFTPPVGGVLDEPIIPLAAYAFAEPQVVLTNTAPIGIQQWLPDNETLLVTRHTGKGNMLELVNTRTLAITRLVDPNRAIKAPRWLAQDQSVVWVELGGGAYEPGHWVRSFDPPSERHLSGSGTGSGISHDVSPDGKQVVFLSLPGGTQPYIWNQESKTLRGLPIDLDAWRYQKLNALYPLRPFNVHWHPGGEQLLFEDGIWLFLYDLTTNSGCEIDMHTLSPTFPSVHEASWSPNGRYLLLKIALDPPYTSIQGPGGLVLVLDTYTGETTQHLLSKLVYGFSWAPDSQTVAMIGVTEQEIRLPEVGMVDSQGIYLLNVHDGEKRQVLPEYFAGGLPGLVWSPDGARLGFNGAPLDNFGTGEHSGGLLISQVTLNQ